MAKRKYRVREGFTYGAHDEHAAGSIVELEEEEAKFVMDKLELAEIVQNVPDSNDLQSQVVPKDSAQMTADSTDSRSNSPETVETKDDDPKTGEGGLEQVGKSSTLRKKGK